MKGDFSNHLRTAVILKGVRDEAQQSQNQLSGSLLRFIFWQRARIC